MSSLYVTAVAKQRIKDQDQGDVFIFSEEQFFDWVKTNSPATAKACAEAWDKYRAEVDLATLIAGLAYDTAGFRSFVKQMGGFASAVNIRVKPIVFDNQVYLLVTGNSLLRDTSLRGTLFWAAEPKVMAFGVTPKAMITNTLKATKFNVWFAVPVRIVDFVLGDEKTWTWLGVALAVDLAKIGVAGLAAFGAGLLAKKAGVALLYVGLGPFAVGVGIATALYLLDSQFNLTNKIIELLYLKIKSGDREEHGAYCTNIRAHTLNGLPFEIWQLTPHIDCNFPVQGIESIFE